VLRHSLLSAIFAATALAQNTPVPRPGAPQVNPAPATTPVPKPGTPPAAPPAKPGTATPASAPATTPGTTTPASAPATTPGTTTPAAAPAATPGTVTPAAAPGSEPIPGVNTPVPTPTVPPVVSVPAANRQPLPPGGEEMIPLQFINTEIKEVLPLYERLKGVRLIFSNQLVGNVYIFTSNPVPKTEAITIMELSLAMNGIFIEPTEDDRFMRVTGVGSSPKQYGVPLIDSEAVLNALPVTEQVVSYIFKLKWADPTEVAQVLAQAVLSQNPNGNYSAAVPLPKASSVIVTENAAFVRQIIKFMKAIDVEPADVKSEFITLEHAQAEDVVANLEKIFEKTQAQLTGVPNAAQATNPRVNRIFNNNPQGANNPGNAIGGAPVPAAPEAGPSFEINGGIGTTPNEENIIVGKVKIAADKRTNRIHVVTRPVNLAFIKTLIKEYDAEVPLAEPAVRAMRYRPVSEVIDAVVAAIKDPGERDTGATGAQGTTLGQGARPGQTNQGQNATQNRNNLQANYAGGNGGAGDTAGALGESLSTTERDTIPIVQQVGKSTIIADNYANTIVVIGTSDVKEKVLKLLDQLDTRQAMVMVQVVIGELRLSNTEQFGMEYILKNGPQLNPTNNPITGGTGTGTGTTTSAGIVGFNDQGAPVINLNGVLNQAAITKIAAGGGSGLGAIYSSQAFDAVLSALESSNRFRVISKPRVFTTNNKRAIITSGEEVPVPTNIQSSFANTGNSVVSNSSIQYKPIELRLEVLPLINSDREVSLEIVQNISDRSGTTTIDNNAIPNVTRRAVKTYVTVPNKGTLILGGLIKESQDFTKSGIPRLVNIPWIGPLFGKTSKEKIRSELIIMMRPIVTVAPAEGANLREKTFEDFNIPPDFDAAIIPKGKFGFSPIVIPKIIQPPPATRPSPVQLRTEEPVSSRRR
jgi:type II secretion system protein D